MARQALILTEKDILEIDLNLVRLLKDSEARCALLVDQDGRMLARKGFTREIDCETLAALIAGSFASTRAMAKLVGESEFSVLFHQGEKDHIHNVLVDENTILTVIFDDRTTIGMVRVYAKEVADRVKSTLQYARVHNQAEEVDPEIVAGLVNDASSRLDNMFGEFETAADAPGPAAPVEEPPMEPMLDAEDDAEDHDPSIFEKTDPIAPSSGPSRRDPTQDLIGTQADVLKGAPIQRVAPPQGGGKSGAEDETLFDAKDQLAKSRPGAAGDPGQFGPTRLLNKVQPNPFDTPPIAPKKPGA